MELSGTWIDIQRTGERLKKLSVRHGYSVKDIQEYLGLSCPQSIYRWYKGIILPSVDHLLRLSELYHLHMEDLLVYTKILNIEISEIFPEDRDRAEKRMMAYLRGLAA